MVTDNHVTTRRLLSHCWPPDLWISGCLRICTWRAMFTWVCLSGFFAGAGDCSCPSWLRSLMTVSCCVTDCFLQNVAISTLLEVINHSQSLALVIEDKMKRYKSSGHNPFFGKLQMVTVPPITPGILKVIAEKTDFYQVFPTGRRWARPPSQPSV